MVKYVDVTPSWEQILPTWLMMYRQALSGDCANPDLVRANATSEFGRMAKAADAWNSIGVKVMTRCLEEGLEWDILEGFALDTHKRVVATAGFARSFSINDVIGSADAFTREYDARNCLDAWLRLSAADSKPLADFAKGGDVCFRTRFSNTTEYIFPDSSVLLLYAAGTIELEAPKEPQA